MGRFRSLRAWQEAVSLAELSAKAIKKLSVCERYALADQWRRAAYSVVLNIAEGSSRRGPREFRRYLDIARGSLHEIEGVLEMVERLGYLPAEELRSLQICRVHCARLVYALLRKMEAASRRSS
jgi:four helix bundle protein